MTNGLGLSKKASGDRDGCDRRCFCAEDARAERDVRPVVRGEEGHLFGGPTALRAYGEGGGWIPHLRSEMWGTQMLRER